MEQTGEAMKKPNEGKPPSDADHRLDDLNSRLKAVRKSRVEPDRTGRRGTQLGFAFRLATELVAGFVVGGLIGWQLDAWFGTLPLFLLIFFGLGAAAGILNVMRTAQSMNRAAEDEAAEDPPER